MSTTGTSTSWGGTLDSYVLDVSKIYHDATNITTGGGGAPVTAAPAPTYVTAPASAGGISTTTIGIGVAAIIIGVLVLKHFKVV